MRALIMLCKKRKCDLKVEFNEACDLNKISDESKQKIIPKSISFYFNAIEKFA